MQIGQSERDPLRLRHLPLQGGGKSTYAQVSRGGGLISVFGYGLGEGEFVAVGVDDVEVALPPGGVSWFELQG